MLVWPPLASEGPGNRHSIGGLLRLPAGLPRAQRAFAKGRGRKPEDRAKIGLTTQDSISNSDEKGKLNQMGLRLGRCLAGRRS